MTRAQASTILLIFVPLHIANAEEDGGKPRLTPEDVLNITWGIRPHLSPDGPRIVYSVIESVTGKRQASHWLSECSAGVSARRVFAEFAGVGSITWSPNGEALAFLGRDSDAEDGRQLFVADAEASEVRCLTKKPNGIVSFRWSSDSKSIAFSADDRIREPTSVIVVDAEVPRDSLWTIDLDVAELHRVTIETQHVMDYAWSPSGQEFAVLVAEPDINEAAAPRVSLRIVHRSDGSTVRVLSETATGGCDLAWSPDGETIAAPVFGGRKISRRLALFKAGGGEPTFPFEEYHATPMSNVQWTEDSQSLFVQFTEKTRNQLIRFEPASGKLHRASEEFVNFWDYSIDRNGTTIAFNAESQHDPPDIFVRKEGKLERLTDFNPDLSSFRLGDVKTVEWRSSLDNRTIYGVLITPPGFEKGHPCPTIVNLHSGPHWLWWGGWVGTYMSWGQYLASNGYAVFMPNHRGSIGRGCEFGEANYLEWGRGDYQDVMDGVDMLVDQGFADPQRLGIGGASYGGYLTAWYIIL